MCKCSHRKLTPTQCRTDKPPVMGQSCRSASNKRSKGESHEKTAKKGRGPETPEGSTRLQGGRQWFKGGKTNTAVGKPFKGEGGSSKEKKWPGQGPEVGGENR